MANTTFSKNLRKLRENKKIPQKSAASSLGISQALLSHYEKGIRECGLDFLARAAKFYGVTTDFLLGIVPENISIINNINHIENKSDKSDKKSDSGNIVNSDNIMTEQFDEDIILSCMPKTNEVFVKDIKDSELKKGGVEANTYAILYKNLLINALGYMFDEMRNIKYKEAAILSGKYISLAIYRLYTLLYNNSNNHKEDLTEKIFMSELKYITTLKNFNSNDSDNENNQNNKKNIFGKYNFENPCLNNIINSNL